MTRRIAHDALYALSSLFVLGLLLQFFLAAFGVLNVLGGLGRDEEPWIGAFRALSSVLVLAVAYYLARASRARRSAR